MRRVVIRPPALSLKGQAGISLILPEISVIYTQEFLVGPILFTAKKDMAEQALPTTTKDPDNVTSCK